MAIGLPTLASADISNEFSEGETAAIDLSAAKVTNQTKGTSFQATPLSPDMINIIRRGGILELLKQPLKED